MAKELRFKKEIAKAGAKVAKLRIAKGWSQRKLADTANVPFSAVNGFERGLRSPNISTVYAIAEALEVDIKVLI